MADTPLVPEDSSGQGGDSSTPNLCAMMASTQQAILSLAKNSKKLETWPPSRSCSRSRSQPFQQRESDLESSNSDSEGEVVPKRRKITPQE